MYGRQPAALIDLQEKSRQELQYMLNSMFANADDAIFELAGHATNNAQQNLYFESMRETRLQRRDIEARFLKSISENFRLLFNNEAGQFESIEDIQVESLSLVQDERLDEVIALDGMVNKALTQHAPALAQLTRFVAGQLERNKLSIKANPLAPLLICQSFMSVCGDLNIDNQAKLIFFRLFDKYVVDELGALYAICNRVFQDSGAQPAELNESQMCSEQSSGSGSHRRKAGEAKEDLTENLSEQFANLGQSQPRNLDENALLVPSGEAPAIPRHQVVALLSSIQSSQAKVKQDRSVPVKSSTQDIHLLLDAALREKKVCQRQAIPMLDEERINIVALLFDAILEDPQMPAEIKAQLGRLQVPMVKVALLDANLFENQVHPARRLLNEVADSAIGWDPGSSTERDDYLQQVMRTVNRVLNEFDTDVVVFEEILAEFLSFVSAGRRRVALVEQRTVNAEDGRAKAEQARNTVRSCLQSKLKGVSVPDFVIKLLNDGWSNVLFLICVKEGPESKNWRNATRTVDHLVWSVQPLVSEADKTRLLKLVPALLKNLRNGLQRFNYNAAQMNAFFSGLEAAHRENIKRFERKKQSRKPVNPQIPVLRDNANKTKKAGESSTIAFLHKNKSRVGVPNSTNKKSAEDSLHSPPIAEKEIASPVVPDKFIREVERLSIGAWVEMTGESGNAFRCRLASIIKSAQRYIFVNRAGVKVAEKPLGQLAEDLSAGRIKILEDAHLFDRALESVIGNVRDIKDQSAS